MLDGLWWLCFCCVVHLCACLVLFECVCMLCLCVCVVVVFVCFFHVLVRFVCNIVCVVLWRDFVLRCCGWLIIMCASFVVYCLILFGVCLCVCVIVRDCN